MNACRSLGRRRLHFAFQFVYLPVVVFFLYRPKSVITDALTAVKMQRALECAVDAREIDRRQQLFSCILKSFRSFSSVAAQWAATERERESEFLWERLSASFVYTDSMLPKLQHQLQLRAAAGPTLPTGPLQSDARAQLCVLCERVPLRLLLLLCVCVRESKCGCVRVLSAKCQRVLWHFFATL